MENNNNMFVDASRRQLRFDTSKGQLSTEDLWSLSLKSLDEMGIRIQDTLQPERKSLLENPDTAATKIGNDNRLRLEIIKFVITTKQEENKAARAEGDKLRQKEFLKELLNKKKIDQLEGLSLEEIEAQLAALG